MNKLFLAISYLVLLLANTVVFAESANDGRTEDQLETQKELDEVMPKPQ